MSSSVLYVPDDEEDQSYVSANSAALRNDQLRRRTEAVANLAANRETKMVFSLKILVMLLLLASTAMASAGVYRYSTNDQTMEFERDFESYSAKMTENFRLAVDRKLGAIASMANAMTTYAQDTNATFPFVTLSNFPVRACDLRVLAEALMIIWTPLINDTNRLEWEEWAFMNRYQQNRAFEQEAKLRQRQDAAFAAKAQQQQQAMTSDTGERFLQQQPPPKDSNMLQDESDYHLRIYKGGPWNNSAEADGSGHYLPVWQRSPAVTPNQKLLNFNFATSNVFSDVLPVILDDPKVVINKAEVVPPQFQQTMTYTLRGSQYRNDVDEYLLDPLSFMAYPVFDSLDVDNRKLAGLLISNLYWRMYFLNTLPPSAKGIVCVLSNSFNQTLSYRVDGPDVEFLGEDDFHDPKYSNMVVTEDITSFVKDQTSIETRAYMTVPLHDTFGLYTLKIYPSAETEAVYRSNEPIFYMILVGSVFLLTAFVFIAFDFWVERRQKIVVEQAAVSGAIVNSLFPETVQDRLYEDEAKSKKEGTGAWKHQEGNVEGLEALSEGQHSMNNQSRLGNQIADLYPDATIMFADLKGFTSWSSSRSPSEVFCLLESLYNAFDAIALQRGVFKVETIGDCYLAVCGLPQPNPDHSTIMVKFAGSCLSKMNELVKKLGEQLGAETEKLQLRVGLHSGPVTAGVLRGQKSRFQLFGDSVNVASRMESTGQGGRIQVSEDTAEQLRARGHGDWLKARRDPVEAKGKGTLSTYWIVFAGAGTRASTCISEGHHSRLDFSCRLQSEESSEPSSDSTGDREVYDAELPC
ncbi:Receptor-type guanylate cyclase gcy [Seminavis robusta]|uniref:Receptor-type guanylate cyclase gcy n=1 Tax=Seminavis robusta TaxID=568900 RepID=A0A9N8EQN9_9STRA|nr:Receptor-type guanylate cyclase gcy [Seminavis robusta]|eukprot:Sro1800_g298430.1 Receptor-type guanylate cyclase gcy (805) ;mRNA; r:4045-7168